MKSYIDVGGAQGVPDHDTPYTTEDPKEGLAAAENVLADTECQLPSRCLRAGSVDNLNDLYGALTADQLKQLIELNECTEAVFRACSPLLQTFQFSALARAITFNLESCSRVLYELESEAPMAAATVPLLS